MSESRPQPVLFRFHVKPAPAPGERRHAVHVSPEAHIVAIRFAVYLQRAALGPPRPKPMHLPRSSTAAGRLPPHRARPPQRETATGHGESASGWSSRATASALPASEEGEDTTSRPTAWNHVFYARRRLQTSNGTLLSDASPLVSRETDSRAWCGRHGRAPTSPPRPALPG